MKNHLVVFLLSTLTAMAVCAATSQASQAGIGPSFKGPLGLQLYSLRADFPKDVSGTMKRVRDFGFENAELAGTYDLPPDRFKELLVANHIKAIGSHFAYDRYRDDPEGVAREAAALGLKYAGVAWIPHTGAFDEKTCREAIGVFNRAGAVLAKHGIKFYYHQHGYEFEPFGQGTLMDLLIKETNPKQVAFQMDIFWVVFPGQDPVKWFEKYGKRWELVHLKDMKKGVKTGSLSAKTDVANDVAIGTGQMDMPAILKAAKKAGVKWYFIEDESPSAAAQIPVSLRYLEQVKF